MSWIVLVISVAGLLFFAWALVRVGTVQALPKKEDGFTLLEMMLVLLIIMILVAFAVPNQATMQQYFSTKKAREQVQTVANAISAQAICNAQHASCPGVAQLIPANGTLVIGPYTYIMLMDFSTGTYSYSATPADTSYKAFYVDSTGLMRCSLSLADGTSPLCP